MYHHFLPGTLSVKYRYGVCVSHVSHVPMAHGNVEPELSTIAHVVGLKHLPGVRNCSCCISQEIQVFGEEEGKATPTTNPERKGSDHSGMIPWRRMRVK